MPDHFGGHPTDYQFVEEQIDGLSKVSLIIRPNGGPVNAVEVVDTIIGDLGAHKGGYEMMAECRRQGIHFKWFEERRITSSPARSYPFISLGKNSLK